MYRKTLILALFLLLTGCAGVEYRCGVTTDFQHVNCGADNQRQNK